MAARKMHVAPISWRLASDLFGVALVSSSAATINQVLEHNADARMLRTRNRPLPAKRMNVPAAAITGTLVGLAGVALLAFGNNPLTAILAVLTALSYAFIYTPLKSKSPISTFIGAFPGAMPAVLGWTAVTAKLDWEALSLFAIGFFWQFPHFMSIVWIYREDYARASYLVLPHDEKAIARIVNWQTLLPLLLLASVSLLPALTSKRVDKTRFLAFPGAQGLLVWRHGRQRRKT